MKTTIAKYYCQNCKYIKKYIEHEKNGQCRVAIEHQGQAGECLYHVWVKKGEQNAAKS